VFLLSLLGLVGVYIDTGLLLVAFAVLQLRLLYKSGTGEDTNKHAAIPTESRWLVVLFFCSGFAALIYQMVWQRALFQAFGVNIESVTIIVSIFMFGLGIGALAGGALSKRFPRHLPHLFVACELLIGLFGLFSISLISAVTQATIHGSLLTLSVATYGLLFFPTLFMGATLPILVSYLYKAYQNVGRSLSVLYFANTLGSALACFACAYLLFLFLGLEDSCNVAAAINFLVAYAAHRFSRNHEEEEDSNPPDPVPARQGAGVDSRYVLILIVSFTVGFVSLSQEILWVRLVSFTTGGRATVFPLVLGFFLIGIALGALRANRLVEKHKDRLLNVASTFIVASSLSYFLLIPVLARIVGVIGWAGVPLMFIGVGTMAFLTGAVLPMLAHYAITSYAHVGFSISWIYFLNIVGSTAGSLLTGFFLINWLSIEQNILLLSAFYFVFGAILWLSSRRRIDYTGKTIVGFGSLAILLFLTYQPLYFDLLERLYHKREYADNGSFKFASQSRYGTIHVVEQEGGDDKIAGGGVYDGRFNTDLTSNRNMIDRAYMMAALHPQPRHVLEIGLSSASWAKVIISHEAVERLDVVEINPEYRKIIQN
jgi:predicted membrane-bound spermidine synthase